MSVTMSYIVVPSDGPWPDEMPKPVTEGAGDIARALAKSTGRAHSVYKLVEVSTFRKGRP